MPIIQVQDVSMRFNLAQEKTETLKEYTVKLLKHQLFFNEFYACATSAFPSNPASRWRSSAATAAAKARCSSSSPASCTPPKAL